MSTLNPSENENFRQQIFIDLAFQDDSVSIYSGWFTYQNQIPLLTVKSVGSNSLLNQSWIPIDRKDVEEALSLPESISCLGFLWIGDSSGGADLQLELNQEPFLISDFSPEFVLSKETILGGLGGIGEKFIEEAVEKGILNTLVSEQDGNAQSINDDSQMVEHYFDHCFITDVNLLHFKGWLLHHVPSSVILTDACGSELDITDSFLTYLREDILHKMHISDATFKAGFIGTVRLQNGFSPIKLSFNFDKAQDITCNISHGTSSLTKLAALKDFLNLLDIHKSEFFEKDYLPSLSIVNEIWQGDKIGQGLVPKIKKYGKLNSSPIVSLIIPIYGRYDFIQHQILAFSNDPDFEKHEIIYVLDDPRIEREFDIACAGVYATFKVPFKTVYASENLGFAGANNLGASVAFGKYILALNSDILPSNNGWVTRLVSKYKSLPNIGILGTKLVYEDSTVQHLGMTFEKDAYYPGVWMNNHPQKGIPLALAKVENTKKVESVTGACMLIEKSLYEQINGFDTRFVLGDFEDSDLCLKCHDIQRDIYLDGEETLYHLERLSQNLVDGGDWKYKLTILNGLYQKNKWGNKILEVKKNHE